MKPTFWAVGLLLLLSVSMHAQSPAQTLLTNQQPSVSSATGSFELGARLQFAAAGKIQAIRYWKLAGEPGPHVGRIWLPDGTLAATQPFVNESDSGWQEQALSVPISVCSVCSVVVSVNSSAAVHFPVIPAGLQFGLSNGSITATSGAYSTSPGNFPGSPSPHNYFRDVSFIADPVPTITITSDGTPGGFTAVTDGFQAGTYTLGVTLKDASGAVISSSLPITMPAQQVGP